MEGSSSNKYYFVAVHLLAAVTFYIHSTSAAEVPNGKGSNSFIETSCSATTYPSLCITSLSSHSSAIQTSPKLLAQTALSLSIDTARSTSAMMERTSQNHGMSRRQAAAMRDCVEELGDSVDELRRSMGEFSQVGFKRFGLAMNDVQTWVSAAMTDEDTCMDSISEERVTGEMRSVVRGRIVILARMTSNALALINCYASTHG